MDLSLNGRTTFITGASRGIGKAIATAFAAEGVNVGLFGRDLAAAMRSLPTCETATT